MPKHEAFSPKAIANRQKLKGLQRLRWYCQMCQKQCRDENGFKCHTMSEGHLRQMRIFGQNSGQILDQFSREFEKGFLQILSHSHGTKRVFANRVYQEYIADKNHVHMNATTWTTLTGFCKYLGREGKCIVDETEKGWFIQYIDRDPQVLLRQAQREERKISELNEEEINKQMIENQVKAAYEKKMLEEAETDSVEGREEARSGEEEEGLGSKEHNPIKYEANVVRSEPNHASKKRNIANVFQVEEEEEEENDEEETETAKDPHSGKDPVVIGKILHVGRKMGSSLERLKQEEEQRKRARFSQEDSRLSSTSASQSRSNGNPSEQLKTWLKKGLVVKVMDRESKYYKRKGLVLDLWKRDSRGREEGVEAEISFLDEDKQRVFAERDLETVIPKAGETGLVLRGADRGRPVKVLSLDTEHFQCDVEFLDDHSRKQAIDYEMLCKTQTDRP